MPLYINIVDSFKAELMPKFNNFLWGLAKNRYLNEKV